MLLKVLRLMITYIPYQTLKIIIRMKIKHFFSFLLIMFVCVKLIYNNEIYKLNLKLVFENTLNFC